MFDFPFKNHPLSIISSLGTALYLFIASLVMKAPQIIRDIKEAGDVGDFFQNTELPVLLLIVFLCYLCGHAFISWRRWNRQSFRLTAETLIADDKRLTHREQVVYRKDISNIRIKQNLLERLLGLATLEIDTNTRSTSEDTDIRLVQRKSFALALREELQNNTKMFSTKTEVMGDKDDSLAWQAATNKHIFQHVLMNLSWLSVFLSTLMFFWGAIALILIAFFGITLGQVPFSQETLNSGWWILIPLLGFISPIFSRTFGVFSKVYGFKIRRHPHTIEISHGLFSKNTYDLPIDKINALIFEQNIFARLFGYMSVKAVNIGFDNDDSETAQLLLTAPISTLKAELEHLLPEYAWFPLWKSQPKSALLPLILPRLLIFSLPLGLGLYFLPDWWKLFLLPILLFLPFYFYLRWRTPGISISDNCLAIREGVFDCKITILQTTHIEQLSIHQPFLARKSGLAYLSTFVLSGNILGGHFNTGLYPYELWQRFSEQFVALPFRR